MNAASSLLQRQSAHRAFGDSSLLLLRGLPLAETFCVEAVRAERAGRFRLAGLLVGRTSEGQMAEADAAALHISELIDAGLAVLRLARLDLEAQPGSHAAAAVLHIRLAEAHVLVAHSGPAQTLGALRGVAASGG